MGIASRHPRPLQRPRLRLRAEQAELLIPTSEVVSWASQHGYLNGANLTDVMTTMETDGMVTASGSASTMWCDGPYSAVDWDEFCQPL